MFVGVSGWRYPRWRGDFYPTGLPQRRELEYVAERMTAVELNGSFYSLQRPSTYRRLVDETPDDFVVAVKGGRFITHFRRLLDVDTALANFFASGVLALGHKTGPLLWQLPPDLAFDRQRVDSFLRLLPRSTSAAADLAARHDDKLAPDRILLEAPVDRPLTHALEVRHSSFCEAEAVDLLREHDVALVVADSPGKWPYLEERTSDLMYVRLHGHTELYASGYSARSLDRWAEKVKAWAAAGAEVHVYFDNDARGRAPYDAVGLIERLG
ncbi:DUF72 domain-containing protein [Nocardia salmonicida]|uniref:DUF72 domain-containing protein n=1 Tax=Nocardia salmonicida TaxID=53431 RepID=UPI003405E2C6